MNIDKDGDDRDKFDQVEGQIDQGAYHKCNNDYLFTGQKQIILAMGPLPKRNLITMTKTNLMMTKTRLMMMEPKLMKVNMMMSTFPLDKMIKLIMRQFLKRKLMTMTKTNLMMTKTR